MTAATAAEPLRRRALRWGAHLTGLLLLGVVYWPLVVLAVQHPAVLGGLRRVQGRIDRLLGGVLVALGVKVGLS